MLDHVDAVLKLLAVMMKDNRFIDVELPKQEGGQVNMCEVLDRIVEEGIEKGRREGIEKGRKEGIEGIIREMLLDCQSYSVINKYTGASEAEIKQIEETLLVR